LRKVNGNVWLESAEGVVAFEIYRRLDFNGAQEVPL
jgi:hypothetical protein